MRSVGKWLGRILAAIVVLGAAAWVLGPREPAEWSGVIDADLSDPAAYLATREAGFNDLVPGTEARIEWAGQEGSRTRWTVVYLHGFSASSEELRPVPDLVAEALGANLVFGRLPGHGRSSAAMGEATAGDWIDDTALMLEVARQVGDRVLVLSTSTGGTLSAYAASHPEMVRDVVGMAFVSPNIRVANRAGILMEGPFATQIGQIMIGPERSFVPDNEGHATYWTERYPTVALVRLAALLRETRARDYSEVSIPALVMLNDADDVISPEAARTFFADWGGPTEIVGLEIAPNIDPHVLAGDIRGPEMTAPIVDLILEWAGRLQD
jgi:alpha-beta hydrolase superfamily lysophospholipase